MNDQRIWRMDMVVTDAKGVVVPATVDNVPLVQAAVMGSRFSTEHSADVWEPGTGLQLGTVSGSVSYTERGGFTHSYSLAIWDFTGDKGLTTAQVKEQAQRLLNDVPGHPMATRFAKATFTVATPPVLDDLAARYPRGLEGAKAILPRRPIATVGGRHLRAVGDGPRQAR